MRPLDETQGGLTIWEQLKQGGFTAALIGMAGMTAKVLLSDDDGMTWKKALAHIVAGGITAWLVDQGLKEVSMADGLKTVCLGVSGASATTIYDVVEKYLRARGDAEVAKVAPRKGTNRARRTRK